MQETWREEEVATLFRNTVVVGENGDMWFADGHDTCPGRARTQQVEVATLDCERNQHKGLVWAVASELGCNNGLLEVQVRL